MKKALAALLFSLVPLVCLAQNAGSVVTFKDLGRTGRDAPDRTTAALTLYVATTGSDAITNKCTAPGSPCLTIQGALARVPGIIQHPVTISVGAGNFAGAFVTGFSTRLRPSATAVPSNLIIRGTMANTTGLTGAASGTVTGATAQSGLTFATLTDSTGTWAADELRGSFVRIGGTGPFYPVATNTSTVITIAGDWDTLPTAGQAYVIQTPDTHITTSTDYPGSYDYPTAYPNSGAGFYVDQWGGGMHPLVIENMHFPAQWFNAIYASGLGTNVYLKFSKVETNYPAMSVAGGSSGYMKMTRNAFIAATGFGAGEGQAVSVSMSQNVFINVRNGFYGNTNGFWSYSNYVILKNDSAAGYAAIAGAREGQVNNDVIICGTTGVGSAIRTDYNYNNTASPTYLTIGTVSISNCQRALYLTGNVVAMNYNNGQTGSGNTVAVALEDGARLRIGSGWAIGGTTEITLDAGAASGSSTSTYSALRLGTPTALRNNYNSMIFQK